MLQLQSGVAGGAGGGGDTTVRRRSADCKSHMVAGALRSCCVGGSRHARLGGIDATRVVCGRRTANAIARRRIDWWPDQDVRGGFVGVIAEIMAAGAAASSRAAGPPDEPPPSAQAVYVSAKRATLRTQYPQLGRRELHELALAHWQSKTADTAWKRTLRERQAAAYEGWRMRHAPSDEDGAAPTYVAIVAGGLEDLAAAEIEEALQLEAGAVR